MKRKALGLGLSALLPNAPAHQVEQEVSQEAPVTYRTKQITAIPVDKIQVNREQPRTHFDQDKLQELAESIRQQGVLQPILVRHHPSEDDMFMVIAGERRFRASLLAGLPEIPCIVLRLHEAEAYEISLIENIQRSDLSPVEEAKAYKHLIDRFQLTQEEIATRVGKSRESVANTLRFLNLPETVISMIDDMQISSGHAKVLLSLRNASEQEKFAQQIAEEQLTVRETERLVRDFLTPSGPSEPTEAAPPQKPAKEKDIFIEDLEQVLEQAFQTKVRLNMKSSQKGQIQVDFYDLDQLDSILKKWNVKL